MSPDGIAKFFVPSEEAFDETEQEWRFGCVEIKTRVAPDTIQAAESAAQKFGRMVECHYGDEKFNGCVPTQNCRQVMHQAVITGLSYGIFVTAKVQDGTGSLVQIVVVCIENQQKAEHINLLKHIGMMLIGWAYDSTLLDQGYLEEDDFPTWVPERQRAVLASQYPLFVAQYKIIKGDGDFQPVHPVSVYKHLQQYTYNHRK